MGLYRELQREGYRNIARSTATDESLERDSTATRRPSTSKIDRFGRAVLEIDNGRVVIPTKAAWLDRFLHEVAAFPNIADKGQVGSMSQVVANVDAVIRRARNNANWNHH
jgi:phage terminase large subunit-like protein